MGSIGKAIPIGMRQRRKPYIMRGPKIAEAIAKTCQIDVGVVEKVLVVLHFMAAQDLMNTGKFILPAMLRMTVFSMCIDVI